jgi:hypothetical protein
VVLFFVAAVSIGRDDVLFEGARRDGLVWERVGRGGGAVRAREEEEEEEEPLPLPLIKPFFLKHKRD